MLSKQRSYIKSTEVDTLELITAVEASTAFLKSIPVEVQQTINQLFIDCKSDIEFNGSEHPETLDRLRALSENLIEVRHFANARPNLFGL